MILTEKEAAEKWCPLGRVVSGEVGANGAVTMYIGSVPSNMIVLAGGARTTVRCIGSNCMAWRKVSGEFDANGNLPGYCGAFGKVEQSE